MTTIGPDGLNADALAGRLDRRRLLERGAQAGALLAAPSVLAAFAADATAATRASGTFRFAVSYDSESGTFDPAHEVIDADGCRRLNTFDTLMGLTAKHTAELRLAQTVEANAASTVYTVRLRSGVTFHDGKPCTADDLIYSVRRILDPKAASGRRTFLAAIDPKRIQKLDAHTVRFHLARPNNDLPLSFCFLEVVQNGATDKSFTTRPIGTGPFMFDSWTPGRETNWKANPNYWVTGLPKVAALKLVVIQDNAARINALLGGDVDAIERVDLTRVKDLQSNKKLRVRLTDVNAMVPITMRLDRKPFSDVRVRQAMKLIADRNQLVTIALNGYATVANDLYGRGQPLYDTTLPQRKPDVDKARSLLKAAGVDGQTFKLSASDAVPGMLESATVFAQQARKAGVKVVVQKIPSDSYFGQNYPYTFGQSAWADNPLSQFYELGLLQNAPFPETGWKNSRFDSLFRQSQATRSQGRKKELYHELQQLLYDEGGYLQWSDSKYVDAYSTNVGGVSTRKQYPLGSYDFRAITVR